MSLSLKSGVRLHGLRPELVLAAQVVDQVYEAFGAHQCVITAGVNGVHLPSSSHYRGEALDFRTQDPAGAWSLDEATRGKIRAEIQARLGDDFQVMDEGADSPGASAPHLHLQWRPTLALTSS